MTKIEKRWQSLVERAEATGLFMAALVTFGPKPDEGYVELPPLTMKDSVGLTASLDLIEATIADWEAHPESPRESRPSARYLAGYVNGYLAAMGPKP